jgi:hypothetical protein
MKSKPKTKANRARPQFAKEFNSHQELHAWVKEYLDINIPQTACCPGHSAPFDYLASAYFEPSNDLVVWAPRGGGKTRLGAIATLLDLVHKPKCSIRILGGSMEQSLKMWEHLRGDLELLKEKVGDDIGFTLGAQRVRMKNGSVAAVLAQSEKAVRGLRVQKLRCDEVELFEPKIWEAAQLVTRTLQNADEETGPKVVAGVVEVFSTLHRPWGMMQKITDAAQARGTKILRWCLLEVLERCPEKRDCHTCPLHPECQGRAKHDCDGFFSIDDAIAMKSRVSIDTWETEMLCQRPTIKGCVFPTFNAEVHVKEIVDGSADSELWLGIDFGFANPFVALWIKKFADGTIHVIDEYVQQAQTIDTHITELNSRTHGQVAYIGCDPAGSAANDQTAQSNVAILRKAQYSVRTKGSKIVEGLEMIRLGLKSGTGKTTLFIHPRCARLIKALQAYRYPDQAGEIPLKDGEHDHLIDALRYFFINSTTSHKCEARRY